LKYLKKRTNEIILHRWSYLANINSCLRFLCWCNNWKNRGLIIGGVTGGRTPKKGGLGSGGTVPMVVPGRGKNGGRAMGGYG